MLRAKSASKKEGRRTNETGVDDHDLSCLLSSLNERTFTIEQDTHCNQAVPISLSGELRGSRTIDIIKETRSVFARFLSQLRPIRLRSIILCITLLPVDVSKVAAIAPQCRHPHAPNAPPRLLESVSKAQATREPGATSLNVCASACGGACTKDFGLRVCCAARDCHCIH